MTTWPAYQCWPRRGSIAHRWRHRASDELPKRGAATLAIVYAIFTLFPLPRFFTAPQFLGYHVPVYIGLLVGICQQLILFVSATLAWAFLSSSASRSLLWARLACWVFGLCSIDFRLAHFTGNQAVARIPVTPSSR